MRKLTLTAALTSCALAAACAGSQPAANTSRQNSTSTTNSAQTAGAQNGAGSSGVDVVSSHGGGANTSAASGSTTASDKAPVPTPELDAKIEKALTKANAKGATAADKRAAAEAYKNRADYYWGAGDPRLYRYALGDYRRVLRYDPDNEEAKERIDYLISIYHSMNKPVPDNGLEN